MAKDKTIYSLTGNKSKVLFKSFGSGTIEKETENYTSSVTSNPIEKGSSIDDHVSNNAGTFAIAGVIVGGDTAIEALKSMRINRELITYKGRVKLTDLVITALTFDYTNKNKDGASFTASFKKVQITASTKPSSNKKSTMADQDAGKSSNKACAATANAGMSVVASDDVSAAAADKKKKAYKGSTSSAPLTRQTGGYDGGD